MHIIYTCKYNKYYLCLIFGSASALEQACECAQHGGDQGWIPNGNSVMAEKLEDLGWTFFCLVWISSCGVWTSPSGACPGQFPPRRLWIRDPQGIPGSYLLPSSFGNNDSEDCCLEGIIWYGKMPFYIIYMYSVNGSLVGCAMVCLNKKLTTNPNHPINHWSIYLIGDVDVMVCWHERVAGLVKDFFLGLLMGYHAICREWHPRRRVSFQVGFLLRKVEDLQAFGTPKIKMATKTRTRNR